MKVDDVRGVIADACGVMPGLQKLAFAGKNFEDGGRTLEQYGVKCVRWRRWDAAATCGWRLQLARLQLARLQATTPRPGNLLTPAPPRRRAGIGTRSSLTGPSPSGGTERGEPRQPWWGGSRVASMMQTEQREHWAARHLV